MAVQKSSQATQIGLSDTGKGSLVQPNDLEGRLRTSRADFNTTDDATGTLAEADVIDLAFIPAGSKILGITGAHEAMGTDQFARFGLRGYASTGYDKAGTADDPIFFTNDLTSDGVDVAAIGNFETGLSLLGNWGYVTDKDCWLTCTLFDSSSSDAWAADKDLKVEVKLVTNT